MIEIRLPKPGPEFDNATITRWDCREGDRIQRGDTLAIIKTSFGSLRVTAEEEGTIEAILQKRGASIDFEQPIAILGSIQPNNNERPDAQVPPVAPAHQKPTAPQPAQKHNSHAPEPQPSHRNASRSSLRIPEDIPPEVEVPSVIPVETPEKNNHPSEQSFTGISEESLLSTPEPEIIIAENPLEEPAEILEVMHDNEEMLAPAANLPEEPSDVSETPMPEKLRADNATNNEESEQQPPEPVAGDNSLEESITEPETNNEPDIVDIEAPLTPEPDASDDTSIEMPENDTELGSDLPEPSTTTESPEPETNNEPDIVDIEAPLTPEPDATDDTSIEMPENDTELGSDLPEPSATTESPEPETNELSQDPMSPNPDEEHPLTAPSALDEETILSDLPPLAEVDETPIPTPAPSVQVEVSPAALKLALRQGIDIDSVRGTGDHGKILYLDVERTIQEIKEAARIKQQEEEEAAAAHPLSIASTHAEDSSSPEEPGMELFDLFEPESIEEAESAERHPNDPGSNQAADEADHENTQKTPASFVPEQKFTLQETGLEPSFNTTPTEPPSEVIETLSEIGMEPSADLPSDDDEKTPDTQHEVQEHADKRNETLVSDHASVTEPETPEHSDAESESEQQPMEALQQTHEQEPAPDTQEELARDASSEEPLVAKAEPETKTDADAEQESEPATEPESEMSSSSQYEETPTSETAIDSKSSPDIEPDGKPVAEPLTNAETEAEAAPEWSQEQATASSEDSDMELAREEEHPLHENGAESTDAVPTPKQEDRGQPEHAESDRSRAFPTVIGTVAFHVLDEDAPDPASTENSLEDEPTVAAEEALPPDEIGASPSIPLSELPEASPNPPSEVSEIENTEQAPSHPFQHPHPHYLSTELDFTLPTAWLQDYNERNHQSISLTDLMLKACGNALASIPSMNASIQGDEIIPNEEIAVELSLPVDARTVTLTITDIDQKSLLELHSELLQYTGPDAIEPEKVSPRANFMLSMLNMFGITRVFPSILHPQTCALGVGAVRKQVLPVDAFIGIRQVMELNLACNPLVMDGIQGARFIQQIQSDLELLKPGEYPAWLKGGQPFRIMENGKPEPQGKPNPDQPSGHE